MTTVKLEFNPEQLELINNFIDHQMRNSKEVVPQWVGTGIQGLMTTLESQDSVHSKSGNMGSAVYSITTDESQALAFMLFTFVRWAHGQQRKMLGPNEKHIMNEVFKFIADVKDQHEKIVEEDLHV